MQCFYCKKEIPDDSTFCPECGANQNQSNEISYGNTKRCSSCGSMIPADSRFCPQCSAEQNEDFMGKVKSVLEKGKNALINGKNMLVDKFNNLKETWQGLSPEEKKKKSIIAISAAAALVVLIIICIVALVHKPTIDLNDYITIKCEGYDEYGKATMKFDYKEFKKDYGKKVKDKNKKNKNKKDKIPNDLYWEIFVSQCVRGSFDKSYNLSNGDTIKYKITCDKEQIEETYGFKIKAEPIKVKVKKLKKPELFDPFKDVEVRFYGLEGYGSAEVKVESVDEAISDFRYSLDKYDELSNGDKIEVSISSYTGDDYDEIVGACVEHYGKKPETLTKTYTVEGLGKYATKSSEISDDCLKEMKKKAEGIYESKRKQNWGDEETLKSFEYLGNYFLTTDNKNKSSKNTIYLVYKATVEDKYETFSATNDIYWYIRFDNLIVSPDGETTVDISDYDIVANKVYIDSGINIGFFSTKRWYYYGYKSLDDLYTKAIKGYLNNYTCENNIKK